MDHERLEQWVARKEEGAVKAKGGFFWNEPSVRDAAIALKIKIPKILEAIDRSEILDVSCGFSTYSGYGLMENDGDWVIDYFPRDEK